MLDRMVGLSTRFADWVHSFGEDAGDNMLFGGFISGLICSFAAGVLGIVLSSIALGVIGGVLLLAHIIYMAVTY